MNSRFLLVLVALVLGLIAWLALGDRGAAPGGVVDPGAAPREPESSAPVLPEPERALSTPVAAPGRRASDASDRAGVTPAPLALRVTRWPDGHALADVELSALPTPSGVVRTDANGLAELALTEQTTGVRAALRGYTSRDVTLEALRADDGHLELRPLVGFYGRVVNAEGDGVPGARVQAWLERRGFPKAEVGPEGEVFVRMASSRSTWTLGEVKSGEQGWYFFARPPRADGANHLHVLARAAALVDLATHGLPRPAGELPPLVLGAGPTLELRFVDEAGRGVPDVPFHVALDALAHASPFEKAKSDAAGRARVSVPEPVVRLHIDPGAAELIEGPPDVDLDQLISHAGSSVRLEEGEARFVLGASPRVHGVVLDAVDGSALVGAEIDCSDKAVRDDGSSSSWGWSEIADQAGRFEVARRVRGGTFTLELEISQRGYVPLSKTYNTLPVGSAEHPERYLLERAPDHAPPVRVRGRLDPALLGEFLNVSALAHPPENAREELWVGGGSVAEDGSFEVTSRAQIPSGHELLVFAERQDGAPVASSGWISDPTRWSDLRLATDRTRTTRVRVAPDAPPAVDRVRVELPDVFGTTRKARFELTLRPDEAGTRSASLELVERTRALLTPLAHLGAGGAYGPVREVAAGAPDLTLETTPVAQVLVSAVGHLPADLATGTVALVPRDAEAAGDLEFFGSFEAGPEMRFDDVPAGDYVAVLYVPDAEQPSGYAVLDHQAFRAAGDTTRVDLYPD